MSRRQEGLRRVRGRGRSVSSGAVDVHHARAARNRQALTLVEPLEGRRLLSVVLGEADFRIIGISGNQQSRLTRFQDETLYEIDLATAGTDPALLDGFQDVANPPPVTLTTVTAIPGETDPLTTTGISQGGGALRVEVPQNTGAYWGFQSPNIVDLLAAGADQLSYDLTMLGRELNGGSFAGADQTFEGFAHSDQLAIVLNTPSGGFIQRTLEVAGADDTGYQGRWAGQDLKRHITWDLNQFTAGPPEAPVSLAQFIADTGATDARIWFVTQGAERTDPQGQPLPTQGPMRFYFDNVVVSRVAPPNNQKFDVLIGDFDPVTATKLTTLPFVPDTDAIGYNPVNGLLYRTSGASSYRDDPNRVGYNDNHFMQTVDVSSGTYQQAGVFNANYEGDAGTGPYGLPAPRPTFVLPATRRTPDQTDPAIGDLKGPGEYSSLRDLTWSSVDNAFFGTSDDGIYKLTTTGQSTKVGNPGLGFGGPKGITFATVNGERRLLVTERDGPSLWTIDPTNGSRVDSIILTHAETEGTAVLGLVSIVEAPDGFLYGLANDAGSPFFRDLIRIDPVTGVTTKIGSVGIHLADLAVVPALSPAVVSEVFVRGTGWQAADTNAATTTFMEYLEAKGLGDDVYGYRLYGNGAPTTGPASNPEQILPWINMDEIVVRYSAPPTGGGVPTPGTLTVSGVRNGNYTVTSVTPVAGDPTAYVLRLGKPLGGGDPVAGTAPTANENGDRISLTVPGGAAGGSNFSLGMKVVQGDVDHLNETAHNVLARDYAEVKKRFFKNSSQVPSNPDTDYTPFHDVDGNGQILARDYAEVKKRFFQNLPAAAAGGASLDASSITSQMFASERILG